MKDTGWRFVKIDSMTVYFYKTGEMNGLGYVKIPLRSSAILIFENDDKFCFLWSILIYLRPCNNNHRNRVSIFKQHFKELNNQDFDFTIGFKCDDVHKFEKLNGLSFNIFELNLYEDQNKWRQKLIPIQVSKLIQIDLLIFLVTTIILIKILNVYSGDRQNFFICRRCLNSCTSEKMLMIHKPKCGEDDICSVRSSIESQLHWRKPFHKNPLCFRMYADFEVDNEIDNFIIGNKTTIFINQIRYLMVIL